jgi:hypothetical protein
MRSNDTILLENAYESILRKRILNEDDNDFKFKGADFYSDLKDALGEDVYSLPRQNFYDAIENLNLKENAWYIHVRKDGYNPKPYKIVDANENGIFIEDDDRSTIGQKEIAPAENEKNRGNVRYEIYNPVSKENPYRFGVSIRPDDLIIGPIEDEESIYKIERLMDALEARSKSMQSYFADNPNASMD